MRTALVALAVAAMLAAAVLAATERNAASTTSLPTFVLDALAASHLSSHAGDAHGYAVAESAAIETVRMAAFLGEGPESEPEVVSALVSGPIARGPLPAGAEIPTETDVPFWVVFWQSVPTSQVGPFWDRGSDRVDAVFLVDGVTGDCCWLNRVSQAR